MLNENRLYSISLGVASLQDGLVGVATALSPAMAGHFKFLLHHFFVRLGLIERLSSPNRRLAGVGWPCVRREIARCRLSPSRPLSENPEEPDREIPS